MVYYKVRQISSGRFFKEVTPVIVWFKKKGMNLNDMSEVRFVLDKIAAYHAVTHATFEKEKVNPKMTKNRLWQELKDTRQEYINSLLPSNLEVIKYELIELGPIDISIE